MSKGIQSIELGFELIKAISESGKSLTLSELSAGVSMTPSKARNYLVSLIRTGLIAQNERHGTYKLGPYAFKLGLSAISKFDMMEVANNAMDQLTNTTGAASLLVVWVNDGPMVVAHRSGEVSLPIYFRIGTMPSLSYSATGQIFLAYLPNEITAGRVAKEIKQNRTNAKFENITRKSLEEKVNEIRAEGIVRADKIMLPNDVSLEGYSAIAAPIFNHRRQLAAVLTGVFARESSAKFVKGLEKALRDITHLTSQQAGVPSI